MKSEGAPESYHRMLLEKRAGLLAGFGPRFDPSARMEHLAEDDQAQMSHDEFVSLRLNSLDYLQLRLIDEALDRLAAGDYGVCLGCDTRIPPKRLMALPWARYCVACQQEVGVEREQDLIDARPRVTLLRR
ncbi:MAG TPA: TraR/DksA C4-type zinc finger protein [Bryobacteraceae bacterium]|nr:TraR/DksA C4-type zinc finger protein [Bryobacteraceae bacterium]